MSSLFDLSDKVAIVTGSSKGIGRAIAEALAEHGAKVVISSRKADKCAEVAKAINDAGHSAIDIPCNVGYEEQLEDLVKRTNERWGHIDILVCNAAANPYYGPFLDIPGRGLRKNHDGQSAWGDEACASGRAGYAAAPRWLDHRGLQHRGVTRIQ